MQDHKLVIKAQQIAKAVIDWNMHGCRASRIVKERRGGIHIAYYHEKRGKWSVVHVQTVTRAVSDLISRKLLPLGGIGNYSTKRVPS